MTHLLPQLQIAGMTLLVMLALLWALLPFAVIGIKVKQDRQTRVLQDILNELRRLNGMQTNSLQQIPKPERKESGDD